MEVHGIPAGSHFSQVTGDHFTQTEYRDWVRQASVKEFITGSDTGLSPAERQAIIWTSTRQQIQRKLWLTYRKFNTRKAFRNVWCDIFTVYLSCYHISFTSSFFSVTTERCPTLISIWCWAHSSWHCHCKQTRPSLPWSRCSSPFLHSPGRPPALPPTSAITRIARHPTSAIAWIARHPTSATAWMWLCTKQPISTVCASVLNVRTPQEERHDECINWNGKAILVTIL